MASCGALFDACTCRLLLAVTDVWIAEYGRKHTDLSRLRCYLSGFTAYTLLQGRNQLIFSEGKMT